MLPVGHPSRCLALRPAFRYRNGRLARRGAGSVLAWLYPLHVELNQNEQLIWRGHPSGRSSLVYFLKWGFLALLPVSIAGLLKLGDRETGIDYWKWVAISIALLVVVVVIDVVRRALIDYVVTDQRLRIRRGILTRREQSASIERVQNVNTTRTLLDRMLRIGDIDFDTAGAEAVEASFSFAGVARPLELVRLFERHVALQRNLPPTHQ